MSDVWVAKDESHVQVLIASLNSNITMEKSEDDPAQIAMGNSVVLRHIFTYLPSESLFECSLVNKTWNVEVRSFIRDHRKCTAVIMEEVPCWHLNELNESVKKMSVVAINSLTICLGPFSHSRCIESPADDPMYEAILTKLNLKYLTVTWDCFFGPETCPANAFLITLLKVKLSELSSLKFYCVPPNFRQHFDQDWSPWMPKLRVMDLAIMDGWVRQRDLMLKMLQGAPNLLKLRGFVDPQILEILPDDKFSVVDNFRLSFATDEEEESCWKLADSKPELRLLFMSAPGKPRVQDRHKFYSIVEKLLQSSCKSLYELNMNFNVFPLGQLNFPPLENVKMLTITTDRTSPELLNVIQSIDYRRVMPVLREVQITADFDEDDDEEEEDMPVDPIAPVTEFYSPTVTTLKLEIDLARMPIETFGKLYPALENLEILPRSINRQALSYEKIWSLWRNLESLDVVEGSAALNANFDAEYLGIFQEEVDYLSEQDDEFLTNVHIVPVRPSVLTATSLRSLRVQFDSGNLNVDSVPTNKVYLSRVTGLIALKKLTICITSMFPEAITALDHLRPFGMIYFDG